MKIKTKAALNVMRSNHALRYKDCEVVGPIRAHGNVRLHRGGARVRTSESGNLMLEFLPQYDGKPRPHFKGFCQAAHTGDIFHVSAWVNELGTLRFEICEHDGYAKPNIIQSF